MSIWYFTDLHKLKILVEAESVQQVPLIALHASEEENLTDTLHLFIAASPSPRCSKRLRWNDAVVWLLTFFFGDPDDEGWCHLKPLPSASRLTSYDSHNGAKIWKLEPVLDKPPDESALLENVLQASQELRDQKPNWVPLHEVLSARN